MDFSLIPKATLLQEIIVKTGSPLRIKGDTTIYTADSFKVSANAKVEELLKKLPGITVDKDGKITAMGQTVEKVLVDGEEFFGQDPGMAVKNLRADAVKEVQVFDKKSDQAEFTGIDDGKTQKTINLKLKDDSKHGYFGKADILAGPQKTISNRYNDNLMFSSFRANRKLSAYFLNGNTGQDRLSWDDMQKYGGSDLNTIVSDDGSIIMFMGGNSDDEPYVDPQNGFMTNVNGGLQYSNKWSDKYKFNFTPQYNYQRYTNQVQSFTQTQVGDSVLNQNTYTNNLVSRHNFKLRGIWDLNLDSMNSLKITANANFYHTESEGNTESTNTGNNGTMKNSSNRNVSTNNNKSAISGNIIFQHKFKKQRRTLSINGSWNILNTHGLSTLISSNQSYFDGKPAGSQELNRRKTPDMNNNNIAITTTYTEPLNKDFSLQLSYMLSLNHGTSLQVTRNYSPASGKYEEVVDSLTNNFRQTITQQVPKATINFSRKKLKMSIGSGFGFTSFNLKDITMDKIYDRHYVNYYPSSNITYTYRPNHSIRLNYNGRTSQPSINQLQPLRNTDDYYNQFIGNANLKPAFGHTFSVSHYTYNVLKDMSAYIGGSVTFTRNAITNNQIINVDSGKTITQPVNVNGNISGFFYGGIGFKIKPVDTRININPALSFGKYVGMLNNKATVSKTFAPTINININKEKENKYDLSIYNSTSYNSNRTSQNNTRIHYIINNLAFDGTIYLQKVWSFNTTYNYYFRQKIQQSPTDLNTHIIDVKFQRTFRNNEFTGYIGIKDLFDQNIGINRSFFGTTYSQTINERLKRYFFVGFTWNFKNKSTSTKK